MALRALLAAHAQSAWNRSTRQLTKAGRNFALGLIAFTWLFAAGGFFAGMTALGWAAGTDFGGKGFTMAGVVLFALSWGVGGLFGLTGGGRLLEVGQLKAYPVRPLTLLFAELAARLADPLTLGVALGLVGFHVGLTLSAPQLLPRLLVLFPLHLFILVALQFVLGELLQAIARRARVALAVLAVFAVSLSPRAALFFEANHGNRLERLERLVALIQWLPTTRMLNAPESGLDAALRLFEGALAPLLLLAAGAWVMNREQTAHAAVATERETSLWSFTSPDAGVARLHLATLFRTPIGRYHLVAPLFAMLMMPWLMQLLFQVQRAALAVFIYAALGAVQLHFNMFGFDGPAISELFRLPLSSRTVMLGKHTATLALCLLEGAGIAVFLRLVRAEALDECVSGLCVFIAINLFMSTIGRFVSVLWPRTLPRSGMRGSAPPLPVVMVNLFGTLFIAGSLGLTHFVVQRFAPEWLMPWGAAVLALSALVFAVTLKPAAAFLDARREHVLLAMK